MGGAVVGDDPGHGVREPRRCAVLGVAAPQVGVEALEEVRVAGSAHELGPVVAVEVGLPPEHGAVEGGRALGVGRVEQAPVPRSRLVDQRGALAPLGLPDRERGARGIGEHSQASGVPRIERRCDDRATRLLRRPHGVVGTLDADVGGPGRGVAPGSRPDRSHVAAPERGDVVRARAGGHVVLERPAEQAAVEAQRGLSVGLLGVDPARDPGRESVAFLHRGHGRWCAAMRARARAFAFGVTNRPHSERRSATA